MRKDSCKVCVARRSGSRQADRKQIAVIIPASDLQEAHSRPYASEISASNNPSTRSADDWRLAIAAAGFNIKTDVQAPDGPPTRWRQLPAVKDAPSLPGKQTSRLQYCSRLVWSFGTCPTQIEALRIAARCLMHMT